MKYQEFLYDILGMTVEKFMDELNIPVFLDNGCTVYIMPKTYYDKHETRFKCKRNPSPNYMVMHTGNSTLLDSNSTDDAAGCNVVATASS